MEEKKASVKRRLVSRLAPGERSALREGSGDVEGARFLRAVVLAVLALALVALAAGGYMLLRGGVLTGGEAEPIEAELSTIKIYFPTEKGLALEERRVIKSGSPDKAAEVTVGEFLKGPAGTGSFVPEDAELLGIYNGTDGILYVDLSDEFRSNFQGDARDEFLLLRGLYESIMSSVPGVGGIKILIDGKEIGSIGGHISLPGTLGDAVSHIMVEEDERR